MVEQHWRVNDVAARLGVSRRTVIRQFEDLPGVMVIGERRNTKSKKRHRVFLIPDSILREHCARLAL